MAHLLESESPSWSGHGQALPTTAGERVSTDAGNTFHGLVVCVAAHWVLYVCPLVSFFLHGRVVTRV